MSFVKRPMTEEEIDINNAIDAHRDAMKDELNAMVVAGVFYFAGFLLVIFSPKDSRAEHIGNAFFILGLLLILVNVLLGFRTRKYRRAAKELVDPYIRRKALPFYQELTEMFADKPGVHLHLAEDGKIVVTDRRKAEDDNQI